MKNKRFDSVKYIIAKNARSNGSSIIQHWISMLLTGICGTTEGAAAVITVDDSGGADYLSIQAAVDAANRGMATG